MLRERVLGFLALLIAVPALASDPPQSDAGAGSENKAVAKQRVFVGTFQVPAKRRQEILQAIEDKGFKGVSAPADVSPETILFHGSKSEYEGALGVVHGILYPQATKPRPRPLPPPPPKLKLDAE